MMQIGVDIGGTKTVIGLIDNNGNVLDRLRFHSKDFQTPRELADQTAGNIAMMMKRNQLVNGEITHLGVGIPGTADWENGVVLFSPNLMGQNIPLADYIQEDLGIRPTIVQDSWAGAYAEYLFGQKEAYSDMMCVTLGTGIGCGIIQHGKVFSGAMHTAGEIGHVSFDPNGRLCGCGKRGCLETYASGTGIYAQAQERFAEDLKLMPPGAESVVALARQGHKAAQALLKEAADKLAFGLAALVDIYSCRTIFVSGGLSDCEDYFIAPMSERIRHYGYPAWSLRYMPLVKKAALGYDAPLIGAALLNARHIV